ncbi:MAG: transglutaminase-like domain-containing protein [Chloroflexota bacterium]
MAELGPSPSTLAFYAAHGPVTDPGPHHALLAGLPADLETLCALMQGLLVHVHWAERLGLALSEARRAEVNLRAVARQLERLRALDDSPLAMCRPPERRLVGNCRDFSVLLCAILRHQHVPARARCGFATYFRPGHFEDHWVCEVWDRKRERWRRVDAQLEDFQRQVLAIDFDPLDVPASQFLIAGEAWQQCRAGEADPDAFGIFDMHGLWFVQGNVVRDLLSLNKLELLPWDAWGHMAPPGKPPSAEELAFMDDIAALTISVDEHFDEVRAIFAEDPGLRPPLDWAA